jgi:cell division protein FtsB
VAARAHAAPRPHGGSRRRPARRPAPRAARRRPAARRGASRVNWERAGRIALTLVLAAVLFSYLNPLATFVQTYRETTAAKAELRTLQAENTQLHARVQSADDPAVLEREARRQGMVSPGERAYVVRGLRG